MKIQTIFPRGENIIIHSARIKLGLQCVEFCVLDTILQRKLKNKETSFVDIENHTGFDPFMINESIGRLKELNIVKESNNQFYLNRTLIENAFKEKEDDYEREFNIFWKTDDEKNVCWPGPKKDAFDKFKFARKKYSFDFIIKQKKNYFKLLEHETWRKPMQATKFLNIKSGQIEEDWYSQWPDHFKKEKDSKSKPLTIEEKEGLYK